MQGFKIPTLNPADVLPAVCLIQLSFCIRWSLKPEYDVQKVLVLKNNIQYQERSKLDKVWGACLVEVRSNANVMAEAAARLHPTLHDATFLSCARIVALKGFEEDCHRLEQLKDLLSIDNYKAEFMIELARSEAQIIRMGAAL